MLQSHGKVQAGRCLWLLDRVDWRREFRVQCEGEAGSGSQAGWDERKVAGSQMFVLTAWTISSAQACVSFFRESCQLYLQNTHQLSPTWAQPPLSLVRTVAVACPKVSLLQPLLPTGRTMATRLLVKRPTLIIPTAPSFLRKRQDPPCSPQCSFAL